MFVVYAVAFGCLVGWGGGCVFVWRLVGGCGFHVAFACGILVGLGLNVFRWFDIDFPPLLLLCAFALMFV